MLFVFIEKMEQERGRLRLMHPSLQKRDLPTRPSMKKAVGPMPKGARFCAEPL